LNQRSHQRIAFGCDSPANVLHRCDSIITGHSDCSEDIRKQPGILNGDRPNHVQPLLLSLLKRAIGNGAPKFFARFRSYDKANDTIN
jgi:hypothetical protein